MPVVATNKRKPKHLRKSNFQPKKNIELLGNDEEFTERFAVEVRNNYAGLELDAALGGAEEQWNILGEVLKE